MNRARKVKGGRNAPPAASLGPSPAGPVVLSEPRRFLPLRRRADSSPSQIRVPTLRSGPELERSEWDRRIAEPRTAWR